MIAFSRRRSWRRSAPYSVPTAVDGGGFGSVQPGHLSVATLFEEEAQRQAWVRLLRLHDSRSRTCSDAAELELLHFALQNTEAFSLLRHTQGEVWLL